ncbi:hypothetical protein V5O48_015394 [Marasmius crinis-equi]|uniref:Uncharacterized protein n=1 Tax=Marasmius crinis-equi TaxID=585013 RepID=A0ABR3EUQ0_9AGAR
MNDQQVESDTTELFRAQYWVALARLLQDIPGYDLTTNPISLDIKMITFSHCNRYSAVASHLEHAMDREVTERAWLEAMPKMGEGISIREMSGGYREDRLQDGQLTWKKTVCLGDQENLKENPA